MQVFSSGGVTNMHLQVGLVHVDDRHPAGAKCLGCHGGDEACAQLSSGTWHSSQLADNPKGGRCAAV